MPGAPPKKERALSDPLPRLRPFRATDLPLAGGRSGLVDLLIARRGVGGAHVDRGADLLELEVVRGRRVLNEVDHVLRVTGIAGTLDAYTLVGVVAAASYLEGLIEVAALTFLLGLLGDLRDGRDGSQSEHRQERRQHHQLLQLLPLFFRDSRRIVYA